MDPFDALRAMNPVPDAVREPLADPESDALLRRILRDGEGGSNQRHRRRGRHILIPLAVAAAMATAAATWIVTRTAGDATQVACYRAVSLSADIVGVEPAGDPRDACSAVWVDGEFGRGPAPPLAACVLPSELVGVFPASDGDPCRRLGLDEARLDGDVPAIVGVQELLSERFGADCVRLDQAEELVVGALRDADLEDWTVIRAAEPTSDRPCASIAVDPATETITLVPLPRTSPG